MSDLKRTQLYDVHVAAGATMVDFGGWEMPVKYPTDIVAEHLYTRHFCSLFDVSHMGRVLVEGPEAVPFLQHVLSSNVAALQVNHAQYAIIPNENGGAIDDAYLNRFEEDRYFLVINAANTDKDLLYLNEQIKAFDAKMTVITSDWAAIALQGPKSEELLRTLFGQEIITGPNRNDLNTLTVNGRTLYIARTGYTGEPVGYEIYVESSDAVWLWKSLEALGAKPAGLGARDTLRLEAGLPLYGHEMGLAPDGTEIPIFAVPLAKFAVNFAQEKGDFVGRTAMEKQFTAYQQIKNQDYTNLSTLPRRISQAYCPDRTRRHAWRYARLSRRIPGRLRHQRYHGPLFHHRRGARYAGHRFCLYRQPCAYRRSAGSRHPRTPDRCCNPHPPFE